ncbi:MAG: hypothetical protein ABIM20_02570 [candidate division WOR-3 bacterium]
MFKTIHIILNSSSLICILLGIYFARVHKLLWHHVFIFGALFLCSMSVLSMYLRVGGLINIHCYFGVFAWFVMFLTFMSGFLFRRKYLRRSLHKILGILTVSMISIQILLSVTVL